MVNGWRRGLRWAFFNLRYFRKPPWDTGTTPPELEAFLRDHRPGRALDLGCGTGTNLLAMARAGWEVTGVDYAIRAVWTARKKLRQAGFDARVIAGDVTGLGDLRGPFDLALDIGCYHGIPKADREAYRRSLLRRLAPGGYFLLYAHLVDELPPGGFGMAPEDAAAFEEGLTLLKREESQDRWDRRAGWMTFRKDEGGGT